MFKRIGMLAFALVLAVGTAGFALTSADNSFVGEDEASQLFGGCSSLVNATCGAKGVNSCRGNVGFGSGSGGISGTVSGTTQPCGVYTSSTPCTG